MATRAKTYLFVIMYKDLTNVNYELTTSQYDTICKGLIEGKACVVLTEVGVLMLADIRAVIKQKEPEPVQEVAPAADPTLSPEEMAWVQQYRDMVDQSKGGYN